LDDAACSRHAQLYTIDKKIEWADSHTHVVTLQVFQPLFFFFLNSKLKKIENFFFFPSFV